MNLRILRRFFEIVLGLATLMAMLLSALFIAAGGVALFDDPRDPVLAVVFIVAGLLLTSFCGIVGWRLVTGRERRGGGLLNPVWVESVAYMAALASAGRASLFYGPEHVRPHAAEMERALKRIRSLRRPTGSRRLHRGKGSD